MLGHRAAGSGEPRGHLSAGDRRSVTALAEHAREIFAEDLVLMIRAHANGVERGLLFPVNLAVPAARSVRGEDNRLPEAPGRDRAARPQAGADLPAGRRVSLRQEVPGDEGADRRGGGGLPHGWRARC